ncbi:MAG: ribonuclease HII [Alphaproteobacteria bacterium]
MNKLILVPQKEFDFSFNYKIIAGIDEVGRGPWAGPVVAAAVIIKNYDLLPNGINDSKKLSKLKLNSLYNTLINIVDYGIGIVEVDEIDLIGIGKASKEAMKKAFTNLAEKAEIALIDGREKIDIDIDMVPIIKGDSKSIAIASASIIAKYTRDNMMMELAKSHPEYLWEKNVGYGTKYHREAIEKHGISKHHRKSFKPIRKYFENIL